MQTMIVLFHIAITVFAYLVSRYLSRKFYHPLLNVILMSATIVIAILLFFRYSYADYAPAKNILTLLLGPATVALAVPMYRNLHILRRYSVAILTGSAVGSLVSMLMMGMMARMGGLNQELTVSLIPKSVTLPFAIDLCQMYGGNPALTVPLVVITGVLGGVFGPSLLTRTGINDPTSRGLALGAISHGIGIVVALLENEEAGAMAGIAMILAGIITTLLAPFVMPLFL